MDTQNRAARKKLHLIYKTTCSVTGRYYIGMHSTDELEDGYLGSGKRLWQSIRKHGVEAHTREILEHLPSRDALRLRETELVNEELIGDPLCMNIALGGSGSWDHLNSLDQCQARAKKMNDRLWSNPDWVARHKTRCSERFKRLGAEGKLNRIPPTFAGLSHSNETKEKMSLAKQGVYNGQGNPSFGRPWIFNPSTNQAKKISADQLQLHLDEGWRRGRK